MIEFKVGDSVRRVKGHNGNSHVGYIGVIKRIEEIDDNEGPWLYFEDGEEGYAKSFKPAGASPVKLKTVHQIVDGSYGVVDVRRPHAEGREGMIGIKISASDRYVHVNAEQLSEAIDVLIQIRDALKANAK